MTDKTGDFESLEDAWEDKFEAEQVEHEAAAKAYEDEMMELRSQFLAAAKTCDVTAMCPFAPRVNDYSVHCPNGNYPKRMPKLHELMVDRLNDDSMGDEVMGLLLKVAYNVPTVNAPAMARDLIAKMAENFAQENAKQVAA